MFIILCSVGAAFIGLIVQDASDSALNNGQIFLVNKSFYINDFKINIAKIAYEI